MTDYSELKRLAEGAVHAADHWGLRDSFERQLAKLVDPETVLALIAENEAMAGLLKRFVDGEHDHEENQAERHMYFTEAQSLLALVSGELEAHTIVPDSAIKTIRLERDQLRAEVAGLKTGYEAYEQVNAELKAEIDRRNDEYDKAWRHNLNDKNNFQALTAEVARLSVENDALRKERDARHPFKPFHEPSIGFTGCVICGVYTDHGGLPCPKTRATADAATGKGEQS